jgi:hypothetical protein
MFTVIMSVPAGRRFISKLFRVLNVKKPNSPCADDRFCGYYFGTCPLTSGVFQMNRLTQGSMAILTGWMVLVAVQIEGASIKVVSEFIYPTGFEPPEVVAAGGGVAGGGAVGITPSIPTDFRTREVGVVLNVPLVTVNDPGKASTDYAVHLGKAKIQTGNTDLMIAAATGDLGQVKKLLTQGVAVNAQNKSGSTALMGAAAGGFVEIVETLLRFKANPNLQTKSGSNALMFASRNGHSAIVNKLLDSQAKVNNADHSGNTAVMYAIDGGHKEIVENLMAKGATVNYKTRNGLTPLQYASAQGHQEIVVLLTRAGSTR